MGKVIRMKTTKLKENNGFAIVSVVFLLFVLSLMGTAMFMYSVTSLRSVRYLSDHKKAEYLAQAGVEATSYAYQLAVKSNESTAGTLIAGTSTEGSKINSNRVYLVYVTGTGYRYVEAKADGSCSGSYSDDQIIGYYEVEIESKVRTSTTELLKTEKASNGTGFTAYPVELKEQQRYFTATGHTYASNAVATKKAYIPEPSQAMNKYYDIETGIIDGSASGTKVIKDEKGTSYTVPKPVNDAFSVLGSYKTTSQLNVNISLFNHIPLIGKYIGISSSFAIPITSRDIPIMMGYTSGNMILNEPKTGVVKFKDGQDNMVSLIGVNNVFVNTDIDVTPSRQHFNTLFLKGNNIVINGDIQMYVYGFQKLRLFQNTANLITLFSQNYCLGNVVIGTPNPETATNMDPVKDSVYRSATSSAGYGSCGKVFFGGDVFVTLQIPNVGVYKYKAFSAGDTYYYDDDLPAYVDGSTGYGIDLFKYFMDNAVASSRYSANVNERLAQIMALYYSSGGMSPTAYVDGAVDANGNPTGVVTYNSMRKIDMSKWSNDTYASLIPPDPTDATSLSWILA